MEEKNQNITEPEPKEKPKKQTSEKKLTHLQRARVALVKAREKRRENLHTEAFDKIVDEKLNEKLAKLKLDEKPIAKTVEKHDTKDDSSVEEYEIKKKPKPKKKIIVVSQSSSSDEEVVVQKPKRVSKPRVKSEPKVTPPTYQPPTQEEQKEARRQEVINNLYRNIFNR